MLCKDKEAMPIENKGFSFHSYKKNRSRKTEINNNTYFFLSFFIFLFNLNRKKKIECLFYEELMKNKYPKKMLLF